MRRLVLVAVALSCAGCFANGQIRYREHPELAAVKLATGQDVTTDNLGVVEAQASGFRSCDDIGADILGQLLAESKAIGGTGVRDVKFRARWHWTGHILCRWGPWGYSARARGVAVR